MCLGCQPHERERGGHWGSSNLLLLSEFALSVVMDRRFPTGKGYDGLLREPRGFLCNFEGYG